MGERWDREGMKWGLRKKGEERDGRKREQR